MKIISPVLIVLMLATSAIALETPWDKKLPFKGAAITYKVSGTLSGEKTIYVKDYGKTRAEFSDLSMKMFGMTQPQKEIIITSPDWIYTIDLVENIGSKQANPNKFMIEEFNSLSKKDQKKVLENVDRMGVSTLDGMNGSLEKNAATIMGYACDKVSVMGTTAYTLSGSDLPLKIEGDTMGVKVLQTVSNIQKGSVPSSKFKLPSTLVFEHDASIDQMMQTQAKTAIQNLLAGKNPVNAGMEAQIKQTPAFSGQQASPQPSQAGSVLKQDAKDIGQSAHQEAKDATINEVKEGVKSLFKGMFN